jgi:ABC-type transport system substrate-binding protein
VFHLRKEVTFHDGTDFDAEGVRWSYRRVMDPDEKTLDAAHYNIVGAVKVLDAHTVKFIFKHAIRTVLPVMTADRVGFLQMSPAPFERWGKEEIRLHPVGTGPFKLAKWDRHQVIVLEKNPNFQTGAPLPGSHRVAGDERWNHAGDSAADRGGRLRQRNPPQAC